MERMLVVVFDNESKAYEGARALKQLDAEGSISIHAEAVIGKGADGAVTVKQSNDEFPVRTVGGTAIGSLIGLLGGPVGLAVGITAGALAGSVGDLFASGVDAQYVDDVAAALKPGKCAVIAEVSEEWITPVDTSMEALGGTVVRTSKELVEEDQRAREVAELRAEIAQMKAEYNQAAAERKAKIQARIDQLNSRLEASLDTAKRRSAEMKAESEAKVKALENKAAKVHGKVRAALEARAQRIREERERSEEKLKHMIAGQLRAAAARLEN